MWGEWRASNLARTVSSNAQVPCGCPTVDICYRQISHRGSIIVNDTEAAMRVIKSCCDLRPGAAAIASITSPIVTACDRSTVAVLPARSVMAILPGCILPLP